MDHRVPDQAPGQDRRSMVLESAAARQIQNRGWQARVRGSGARARDRKSPRILRALGELGPKRPCDSHCRTRAAQVPAFRGDAKYLAATIGCAGADAGCGNPVTVYLRHARRDWRWSASTADDHAARHADHVRDRSSAFLPQPAGAVLRCDGHRVRRERLADAGADRRRTSPMKGARRIGTLAILTAVTVVGASILQHALSPEIAAAQQTPLFRLSALFLVLAGVGIGGAPALGTAQFAGSVGCRAGVRNRRRAALSLMENAMPLPRLCVRGSHGRRGLDRDLRDGDPEPPVEEHHSGDRLRRDGSLRTPVRGADSRLSGAMPWNRLAGYTLGAAIIAGWTPFISTRLHRMQEDLSRRAGFRQLPSGETGGPRRNGRSVARPSSPSAPRRRGEAGASAAFGGIERFRATASAAAIRAGSAGDRLAALAAHGGDLRFGVAENGSLYYAMEYLQGLNAEALVEQLRGAARGQSDCVPQAGDASRSKRRTTPD